MNDFATTKTFSLTIETMRKLAELAEILAQPGERPNKSEVLRMAVDELYAAKITTTPAN